MRNIPRSLPYFGGTAGEGKARWINSILPLPNNRQLYVEPYCGMASALLAREPAGEEILNDLNARIMNWWQVVRDEPDKFGWQVEYTPHSRTEFARAIGMLDDMSLSDMKRAWAFHVVIEQGITHGDGGKLRASDWRVRYSPNAGKIHLWTIQRVKELANRIRNVRLECKPAVEVLMQVAKCEDAVIYVDPPRQSADTSPYLHDDVDKSELTAALLEQKGFCAVGGYPGDWDNLGWKPYTKRSTRRNINGVSSPRTEVLWTNRSSPQRLF